MLSQITCNYEIHFCHLFTNFFAIFHFGWYISKMIRFFLIPQYDTQTKLQQVQCRTWRFTMRKICPPNFALTPTMYIEVKGQTEVKVTWHVWARPVVILIKISHDQSMYVAAVDNTAGITMLTTHTPTHYGVHFIVLSGGCKNWNNFTYF